MASQNGRESKDGPPTQGPVGLPQQQQQEHSCEICGASGLSDEAMRDHTRQYHVEGSAQCPFCGLSGVPAAELLLHVNQAHLDYLTPENELMSFIDDQTPSFCSVDGDSDSISDCRGLSPSITSELLTPMSASGGMKAAGFNGGGGGASSTAVNQTSSSISTSSNGLMMISASESLTTVSSSTGSHSSNHAQGAASQQAPGSSQLHHNGAALAGKMMGSSTSTAAGSSSMSSSRSSLGSSSTNLSNGLPNGGHCSNGKSIHSQHGHATNGGTAGINGSGEVHANGTSTSKDGTVMNGGGAGCTTPAGAGAGGQGSPLRSQLGLKLKSHKPNAFSIGTAGPEMANGGANGATGSSAGPATMTITTKQASPLQCLLCPYTSDNPTVLEEHINRSHFDPLSPGVNGAGGGGGGAGGAAGGSGQHADTLSVLQCPICNRTFESGSDLELHVNIEHRDILSPAKADGGRATNGTPSGAAAAASAHNGGGWGGGTSGSLCPVCGISFDHMKTQEMEYHIEKHFSKSPQNPYQGGAAVGGGVGGGGGGGGGVGGGGKNPSAVAVDLEKQAQKLREQREFEMLRAQYGMDDQGNFREQSAAAMQRAVYAGEMSVADYYERQVGLRAAESHGVDDGSSCTKSVSPRVLSLSSSSPNVIKTYVCSSVDHYASSYGDKGWGCGYRNLQMMLSSLLQNTSYNEALYSAWGSHGPARTAMPSISRLQRMVEAAWAQGFDIQGSEQLGCKLYNTRKWIGATEIVTVLSWLRIRCELVDFHRPTSADGRHPELFNWVLRYFEEPRIHTPPLYLQHQGHSRTIIGIEQRTSGLSLLVLDPSHGPRQVAALGSSQDSLRLIRKNSAAMRAPQYQVVAVKGLIDTEDQYQASKVLKSLRIPPDR
uniref:zinc finger-containing ubiquitin peptidase 1-like isoform X1 n=1 Tax=Anopheles coluzzii TaxID=1518534 RepID=UPI0020FFB6BC|nr:zinc finger-containing ubiquitin peptidase 1-like isoform X1 [Anopheles coluzzii]XP_040236302.2 zinc finger-containing ubiquitin peptidase 1-like isoform X1 [Anopheles coluzzii]